MSSVNYLKPEIFYKLLWMSWNASWHAANSRVLFNQNKKDADQDKENFEKWAREMCEIGKEMGFSEFLLKNIQWGAWNAAWWTANTQSLNYLSVLGDKKNFDDHFGNVINSGELTSGLAEEIKWMCADIGWYCTHIILTHKRDEEKEMASRIIKHCLKICPDLDQEELCHQLNMSSYSDLIADDVQYNIYNAPVGIAGGQGNISVTGNAKIAGIINEYGSQKLNDIAQELTALLDYFEQNAPSIPEAVQRVNNAKENYPELTDAQVIEATIIDNPTLSQRILSASMAVTIETIKALLPPVGVAIEAVKAYQNP